VSENVSSQHDNENAVCYLTSPQDLLHSQFIRLIEHPEVIKIDTVLRLKEIVFVLIILIFI
jgi:hypothetical protein